ncbi:hypothetical protein [Microbulbifer donghaiensis]|nr:hypothetical protein [Microbulbifer donghaiensis]
MDRQRSCAQRLLNQQKSDFLQQVPTIPLPAAIGLAFVGGFVAERILKTSAPSRLWHYYLTWRAF